MPQPVRKAKTDPRVAELARIKAMMAEHGLTATEIARRYKLSDAIVRLTLIQPHKAGEAAIAAALGTRPHLLWRTRYRPSGQRRSPQNYDPMPTQAERRKAAAALPSAQPVAG